MLRKALASGAQHFPTSRLTNLPAFASLSRAVPGAASTSGCGIPFQSISRTGADDGCVNGNPRFMPERKTVADDLDLSCIVYRDMEIQGHKSQGHKSQVPSPPPALHELFADARWQEAPLASRAVPQRGYAETSWYQAAARCALGRRLRPLQIATPKAVS